MRDIVNGNERLNFMLNEIVNNELDKTLDEIITVIEDLKTQNEMISCDTILNILKTNKSN